LENVSYQLLKKGLTVAQIDGRSNTYKKRKASGWMKDKSSDALDIVRASSKRYEYDRVIDMATLMQGKAFYYDFQLDSRGRFYPIVNYFEPTGSDLAKSLLMFNHGVPWSENVERALAIHTANCAGEDKISLDDRVLWTYVWMDEILKASKDPYNSEWLNQFSTDKKTKFQLISACLEWKRLEEQGVDDYMCHLPIGLDATNSGLQILSAMTRDRSGAEETNVIKHPDKEIGDAYMVIARSVLDNGFSYKEFENLGDKAWRKLCKRPTMSYYYDAGKGCIQDQTFEDRRDHGYDLLSEMTYDDSAYIGTAIFDGVRLAFPRQTEAKDLLKRAVCTYLDNNTTTPMITWKTATGFTAFQNYAKTSIKRVNCMFGSRPVKLSYQVFLSEARKTDHERGISANFVHSQDASLLAMVIARLAELGLSDFMMIHDQFSVNAENMDLLLMVFKDVFKEIFEVDQLGNTLHSLGLSEVGIENYGDLDMEEILDSKYIIS
jgi:DNA-directed RNA polymerase